MIRKKQYQILLQIVLFGALLGIVFTKNDLVVMAGVVPVKWSAVTSDGEKVSVEECPIEIEYAKLVFNLEELPESFNEQMDESSRVTEEYIFYNPSDYNITLTAAYPVKNIKKTIVDSSSWSSESYGFRSLNMEQNEIKVNNESVEKRIRYTYSDMTSGFETEKEYARLKEDFTTHEFYSPDMPVTKYTYKVSGITDKMSTDHYASAEIETDAAKTRIYVEHVSSIETQTRNEKLLIPADNGETFEIYVIGEDITEQPEWSFYRDYEGEKEVKGTATLLSSTAMTFKELVMMYYDESKDISEQDWYNAVIDMLDKTSIEKGVIYARSGWNSLNVENDIMPWIEYDIKIGAGKKVFSSVETPFYPAIDKSYKLCAYKYTGILSTFPKWKDYSTINIEINTPYYIVESNTEEFIKTDNGYKLTVDELPVNKYIEEELYFMLYPKEEVKASNWYKLLFLLMMGVLVIHFARLYWRTRGERSIK